MRTYWQFDWRGFGCPYLANSAVFDTQDSLSSKQVFQIIQTSSICWSFFVQLGTFSYGCSQGVVVFFIFGFGHFRFPSSHLLVKHCCVAFTFSMYDYCAKKPVHFLHDFRKVSCPGTYTALFCTLRYCMQCWRYSFGTLCALYKSAPLSLATLHGALPLPVTYGGVVFEYGAPLHS